MTSSANVPRHSSVFERIRVEAQVVFMPGRDPGYYARVLNDDLRRFLSPWAFQEGEDILFGARFIARKFWHSSKAATTSTT